MRRVEERPKTSLETETDKGIENTLVFIVQKLPHWRFLKKMAETGDILSFEIDGKPWNLSIKNDIRIPDEPMRWIIMNGIGIATDYNFNQVHGLLVKNRLIGIPPRDFKQMHEDLRSEERQRVLRSYRQTLSPRRTANLQEIPIRRVYRDINYFRRRGLLPAKKIKKL